MVCIVNDLLKKVDKIWISLTLPVELKTGENLIHLTALDIQGLVNVYTLHLEVSDKGTPALSRYKRVIVNVVPK